MHCIHHVRQLRDVPLSQWVQVFETMQQIFPLFISGDPQTPWLFQPIVICDGTGSHPYHSADEMFVNVNDSPAIYFNGDASQGLAHDTFVITQKKVLDGFDEI